MSIIIERDTSNEFAAPTENEGMRRSTHQLSQLIEIINARQEENAHVPITFHMDVRMDSEAALHLLNALTEHVVQGHGVVTVSEAQELTTTQAAAMLNVSRPYIIGLLERGEIPYRKVGTHRRVLMEDVMKYRREIKAKRMEALKELSELSEALGLDD